MEKQNPLFDISRERGIHESFRIPKIFKNHFCLRNKVLISGMPT